MRDTFRPEKHFPENGGTSKPPLLHLLDVERWQLEVSSGTIV